MSRTPARITQADVARAIRAAKQAGAGGVELRPDGTMLIYLDPQIVENGKKELEPLERPPL
jgi:hypothetical protein